MPKPPRDAAAAVTDWWKNSTSWTDKAQQQLTRDSEAYRRGGAREMFKNLDADIDMAPHLGVGPHSDLNINNNNNPRTADRDRAYVTDATSIFDRDHG